MAWTPSSILSSLLDPLIADLEASLESDTYARPYITTDRELVWLTDVEAASRTDVRRLREGETLSVNPAKEQGSFPAIGTGPAEVLRPPTMFPDNT
jgi:hypothetical protein